MLYQKKSSHSIAIAVYFNLNFVTLFPFFQGFSFKLLCTFFSGGLITVLIKKVVAPKPLLVINLKGTKGSSYLVGAGLIKWNDISKIDFEVSIFKNKLLFI